MGDGVTTLDETKPMPREIRCRFVFSGKNEIRCRFVFSGKNDELTPDFRGVTRHADGSKCR